MRTIRTKIYKFTELSNEAKQNAIDNYLQNESFEWIQDEASSTLDKFCELFSINLNEFDFLENYRSRYSFDMEDNILELSGQRLATYIWNNFKTDLFKGKYYNSWTSNKKVIHPKVKSVMKSKNTGWTSKDQYGEYWNVYRGIKLEHSCVLTGVCYDEDILQPIYDFLNKPNGSTFKDLLEECLSEICKTVENEIQYNSKEDAISDHFEANEYEFKKDGTRF